MADTNLSVCDVLVAEVDNSSLPAPFRVDRTNNLIHQCENLFLAQVDVLSLSVLKNELHYFHVFSLGGLLCCSSTVGGYNRCHHCMN